MFRYVAIAWDEHVTPQASTAHRLGRALQRQPEWHAALDLPGLCIYTTGAQQGVNGTYPLPGQRGAILGRLFRREELGNPKPSDPHLSSTNAEQIVRSDGRALINDFWGRYVAFLPTAAGQTRVLRDPSAALPCFRTHREGVGVAFSWLEDLLRTWPEWPLPPIHWQNVGAYLLLGGLGGTQTCLEGIFQVPAGTSSTLTVHDTPVDVAWDAVDIARTVDEKSPVLAAPRLRKTVRDCVSAWAACYDSILLRLSGGVDSSILLSCLDSPDLAARVTCLNYHAGDGEGDERGYARLAARRAGVPLVERACDPYFDLSSLLDDALTPVPESHAGRLSMALIDAEMATLHRAPALFTGGGGDQLFFELRCTWPAADYLRTCGIDRGLLSAIADAARLGRVSIWRAAWLALRDAWWPADPGQNPGWQLILVAPEVRASVCNSEDFTHPVLRQCAGLPIGKLRQVHELLAPAGYYDPGMREAAPELVNPLLSQPAMELCLALPTYLLTRGGRGRALAREAFADDIPSQIAKRRTKGGMDEHVAAVLQLHLPFARKLLLDGQLVAKGLLDRRRLDASLSDQPSTRVAGAGELHHCIAVEAWIHRWSAWHRARSG